MHQVLSPDSPLLTYPPDTSCICKTVTAHKHTAFQVRLDKSTTEPWRHLLSGHIAAHINVQWGNPLTCSRNTYGTSRWRSSPIQSATTRRAVQVGCCSALHIHPGATGRLPLLPPTSLFGVPQQHLHPLERHPLSNSQQLHLLCGKLLHSLSTKAVAQCNRRHNKSHRVTRPSSRLPLVA